MIETLAHRDMGSPVSFLLILCRDLGFLTLMELRLISSFLRRLQKQYPRRYPASRRLAARKINSQKKITVHNPVVLSQQFT